MILLCNDYSNYFLKFGDLYINYIITNNELEVNVGKFN